MARDRDPLSIMREHDFCEALSWLMKQVAMADYDDYWMLN